MEATGTRWETARVEAFSDGVFAIAITLLVLEIGIDPANFDHLWRALADEWPSYLAYVTSFLTVGGVWLAHHRLYSHLRYVDPMLMRLNILVLMAASFLPFPTSLLAEAFDVSTSAERAAVVVYGVTAGADRGADPLVGALGGRASGAPRGWRGRGGRSRAPGRPRGPAVRRGDPHRCARAAAHRRVRLPGRRRARRARARLGRSIVAPPKAERR